MLLLPQDDYNGGVLFVLDTATATFNGELAMEGNGALNGASGGAIHVSGEVTPNGLVACVAR